MPKSALQPGSEQLEHAPSAGAEIEQRAERPIGESLLDFGFHRCVRGVQSPDAVPLGRMLPEIGLCRGRAGGTYRREALTVARHHAIIGIEQRRERAGELGLVAVLR